MQSSPEAARLTLWELIVGALLASDVTQAILALTPRLGGQAYHWMLERFRLLGRISALCRIVRREIGVRRCFVVIDGSLDNAEGGGRWHLGVRPGVAVRFDHAAKANRPAFLRCQGFVTLSAVVPGRERSVPPACAAVPARSPWPRACCARSALSGLLLDAWSMRGSLIHTALRLGHEVIGQATPPCSRCPHRASPEGAAGSMARALMPTRLQPCPPRPLPAMAGPAAPCRPRFLKGVIVRGGELAKGSG